MKSGFLLLFFLIGICFWFIFQNKINDSVPKNEKLIEEIQNIVKKEQNYINFGNLRLNVEIIKTEEERVKGLSLREKLDNDSVVLFVFDKPNFYGIWMKEMLFPIDIAWLDENKKIVSIEANVSPQTYPKIFYPSSKSK